MGDFSTLLDKRIEHPTWPGPVRIIRITKMGLQFQVLAEDLSESTLQKRLLDESVLTQLQNTIARPTDFKGNPELFALGVEARRIQLGYTFDPFFAVSTSRIDPLPHQLEAVYGHLLKKPRIRFVLADDPGAGKTVMAGLLLKELKYRGSVERVLVVTPANLTDQWQREMSEKFGERFEVMNRNTVSASYNENPWTLRNQIITSVDFAKNDAYIDQLGHVRWDLVIVDEAHKLSAKKYGNEIKRSQRYQLGQVLAQQADNVLFLTATPHQGDDEQFRLLLNLLEEDLFATRDLLEEAAAADENPILLRRLKEQMTDFEGKPIFTPRFVHTPKFELTPYERNLYRGVTTYVTEYFKLAWTQRKRNVGLAMTVLQRRLASSSHAIACSLENRYKRLVKLRDGVRNINDSAYLHYSEEDLEDMPEEERWALEDEYVERLTLAENKEELDAEIERLQDLADEAKVIARQEKDRKLVELLSIITNLPENEKLLVFTEHKDTLNFLVAYLQKKGFVVNSIDGSMRLEERVLAEREFRDRTRIMVATEAAGEGINLQFCSVVVNYDLPWNPTRLEQRMGRVHRYGQQFDVHIYNLVAQGTREGDVLGRLLEKLEAMREQLGSDRVYDVVGELLSDVNLDKLIREHLEGRKTLAEIQAMVDARVSPQQIAHLKDITLESLAQKELDLSRLREQKKDSELHRLQPEYIERFFLAAFRRLGGTVEARQDGLWRIKVPFDLRQKKEGVTREYLRATFDPKQGDADFISPGHPLFDAVLETTLADSEVALQQGAAYYLPQIKEAAALAYLELAVVDGLGQTVSRKLYASLDQGNGEKLTSPEVLVDALPNTDTLLELFDAEGIQANFVNWAHDTLLPEFLNSVKEARLREVAIRRKYGLKSLRHLISESNKKLASYKLKERDGEDMGLAILQEQRKMDDYSNRRSLLESRLEKEATLNAEPASLLALAHATPHYLLGVPNEDDPDVRKRVELAAMRVASDYERTHGRTPEDVSADNVGFDIYSTDRAIEVKGRAGVGPISLTPNEWITARRYTDEYYLYIVTNALSAPALKIIRNPAAKLEAVEEVSVSRYIVPVASWQGAADEPHG